MAIEFADSNRGRVAYEEEVAFGEANGAFGGQIARITSSSLIANKGTTVSDELRADRVVSDLIETDFTTGGDLGAEWSLGGTWDEFLRAALGSPVLQSTRETVYSNTTLTLAPNNEFSGTVSSSDSCFTGTEPDDWIYLSGFVNETNNGWKRVYTKVGVNEVTVATWTSRPLIAEAALQPDGTNLTFINGVEKTSFNVEQYFADINIAQLFLGQRISTWSLNVAAGAVVTATWGLMGTSVEAQTGTYTASLTDATTTQVIGATANVAGIAIGEEVVDCQVQSLTLNLDNGMRVQTAIGDKFPCGIGYGRQTITGSMTVYFQNLEDYNAFLNNDLVEISWSFVDNDGNSMGFKISGAKYTAGSPSLEGIDTDVTLTLDFQAIARASALTGNITLYFQNLSDYTDFINHENVSLYWDFQDAVGNHMRMKLPNIKYTTGSPQLEGIDTDVMISCDFQALAYDDSFVGGPRQIEIAAYKVAD